MIDSTKVTDVEIDGIDWSDAPDFCDAYICYAVWKSSGKELTEKELEKLNEDGSFVHYQVEKEIYG